MDFLIHFNFYRIPEFSYDVSELANVVYALVKRASNSPKNLQAICQQSLQEFLGECKQIKKIAKKNN